MNDIVINKVQYIQNFVARTREIYSRHSEDFDKDDMAQDAAIFNILRACEQAIDLANHIIRSYKMGIPTSSSESFELLQRQLVIDTKLRDSLIKMVHFRNTLVHLYQKTDIEIVKSVITHGLDDLIVFTEKIMEFAA
jgi:uncharacterized protein YutE (UPF0331/DUF86 family)